MTKIRLFSALFAVALLSAVSFTSPVLAQGSLNVNLYTKTETMKAGDTLSLNLNFSMFPNLTRFGPIEVRFDPDYVSYVGMDRGSVMPSTFAISSAESTGIITITGADQAAESIIGSNQTAPAADASGNPVAPPADPTMFSADTVTVCVLYFKAVDTAPSGEANFWLGSIGGFRDSASAAVTANSGNTVKVPVQSILSSEAALSSLALKNIDFSPPFSASVFEYNAHVTRDVTKVQVDAVAADPKATIQISGNDNLIIGKNQMSVKVFAEDGKTALVYKINIERDSSFVPDGASIVSKDGDTYNFVEIPDSLSLPSGFSMEMRILGTQSVPVFIGHGLKSMLLYLQDVEKEPALYIYNPQTGSIRLYEASQVVMQEAQLLTVSDLPAELGVPAGFLPAQVMAGGIAFDGYISEKSGVSLICLANENAESRLYEIDSVTGEVFPYKDQKPANTGLLIPFVLVSVLAAAEFGMIAFIIYQVRSRNRSREVKRV